MGDEHITIKGKGPEESDELLPLEMFYEILPRLPLRTLMLFKCVCRQWLFAIQDQAVAHDFLAHHAHGPRTPTVLISFAKNCGLMESLFFSLDLETGQARPIHNLNVPPFRRARISETLNGLVCFQLEDDLPYLCNISTGEIVSLPPVLPSSPMNSSTLYPTFSSLGFDPKKREYKIMKTWAYMEMTYHKILTLGKGVWNNIDVGSVDFKMGGSVFIDGVVHYLTLDFNCKKFVIAFDVGLEKFQEMSLPDAAALSGVKSKIALFRGHLALLDYEHLEDENLIIVYELVDYQKQLWEELRIVLPPVFEEARQQIGFFHVTVISTGEIMLTPKVVNEQFFVLLYNTKTNSLRRLDVLGLQESQVKSPFIVDSAPIEYIESILSFKRGNQQ